MARTLAASTTLASCLSVSERHGGAIIFHFISSFPTTVNTPSPRVCSCDLQLKYPMGAEVLPMWPCPDHLLGRFSGAAEKVSEGFSLGDQARPDLGHWLGKSLTNQYSPGTTRTTVWWFYFIYLFFLYTCQLFAQTQRILTQTAEKFAWTYITWKYKNHMQSLREEGR